MSISVEQITKIYGTQKALDEVSFTIPSGQILGFLGPNGAGKSTLMKILTGYIPQTSGKAKVNGFDILTQSMDVRKSVGYLPESNPLYGNMYVTEYLEFVAGLHGISGGKRALADKMIEMTGLGLERKKQIRMLSKGYKQRVGLAQALIHNPKVLILDEPTSGLDPNQLAEIRSLIKEIGKEKTVMLSTHIMQEVEALCERVIIINRGKIVADDSVEKIQKSLLLDSISIRVEFDKEISLEQLQQIAGVKKASSTGTRQYLLESDSTQDIRPAIFQFAVAHELQVLTLQKSEISLEQAFQRLTKKN